MALYRQLLPILDSARSFSHCWRPDPPHPTTNGASLPHSAVPHFREFGRFIFTPSVHVSDALNSICKITRHYAGLVLRICSSTRTKLASRVSSAPPSAPPSADLEPSLQPWAGSAKTPRHPGAEEEGLDFGYFGVQGTQCEPFHVGPKRSGAGWQGVLGGGSPAGLGGGSGTAQVPPGRHRRCPRTAPGPPGPLGASGGREDGGGSAPRCPRTHLSDTAGSDTAARRGRAAGGAEQEEGEDEDGEEEEKEKGGRGSSSSGGGSSSSNSSDPDAARAGRASPVRSPQGDIRRKRRGPRSGPRWRRAGAGGASRDGEWHWARESHPLGEQPAGSAMEAGRSCPAAAPRLIPAAPDYLAASEEVCEKARRTCASVRAGNIKFSFHVLPSYKSASSSFLSSFSFLSTSVQSCLN
ncbi:collagen alpha-1(III) chain-like isoform X2 [Manacus candei]|uniref:collagen alpha-1(III) chain-like isoform X2 n=1 Tax=Manacus candei TaxID=415023 RepID=UPI0022274DD4|nr:collagen alpha-1(III) chain-like isoform X2 [Manacus candei]